MENGLGEFDELLHQEVLEVKQGFTESLMSRLDEEQRAPQSRNNGIAIAATVILLLNLLAGWAYWSASPQEGSVSDTQQTDNYLSTSSGYQY